MRNLTRLTHPTLSNTGLKFNYYPCLSAFDKKAILVDADALLLELTRYVVLNPVRAGMIKHPGDLSWSSYQAMTGEATSPTWLAADGLLAQLSTRRQAAIKRYIKFVGQGMTQESIWCKLKRQVFLGDDQFVLQMQEKIKEKVKMLMSKSADEGHDTAVI